MRTVGLALVLGALAACDSQPVDVNDPGLSEPWMFNDLPYNVSFVGSNPLEDPALLALGFIAGRDIEVFRMSDAPFDTGDVAEAEAVAENFCAGATTLFVPGSEGPIFDRGGFVFARSCLVREG